MLLNRRPIPERKLPVYFYESYVNVSIKEKAGFIRGLWGANGSVLRKYNRIQLKSVNKAMIQDLQQYLALYFGIRSYISTTKKTKTKFSNGEYMCKESYNLAIYSIDNIKFKERIGFILPHHIENASYLKAGKIIKHPYVASIEYLGEQDVYDFTMLEGGVHYGIVNGISTHNCGEVPLLPYESCCLGSLNLHRFYTPHNNSIDWEFLEYSVRTAIRFLDNVQDLSDSGIEDITRVSRSLRRIGLGVMGFADLCAELETPYDSEEAYNLARKLSWFISFFSWSESMVLAEERGVFPAYDGEKIDPHVINKVLTAEFSPLADETKQKIIDDNTVFDVRNVAVTSIAPTGSIALIAGVNSSIEPFYSLVYTRNITDGVGSTKLDEILEVNEILLRKLSERGIDIKKFGEGDFPFRSGNTADELKKLIPDDLRDVFKTAHEIHWRDHIRIQSAWQEFVSNSVSKTINLPHDATVDEVEEAFTLMWEYELKGGTVYRDGSKSFQILEGN